jgi:hypothetical protein
MSEHIAVVGDVHGNAYVLAHLVRVAKEMGAVAVIQVGDIGWYPSTKRSFIIQTWELPTYCVDGNHEDHDDLAQWNEVSELAKNFFYVPRGTVMEIAGRKIGFLGGAASVDKAYRLKMGLHWSEKELITAEDVAKFDGVDKVDMLVTHTPPQQTIDRHFDPNDLVRYFGLSILWRDPSAGYVDALWKRLGKPPLYCGHMHRSVTDESVRILNIEELILV